MLGVLHTEVLGKMGKKMEKVWNNGLMGLDIKGFIKMGLNKEKDNFIGQTVLFILDNFIITK